MLRFRCSRLTRAAVRTCSCFVMLSLNPSLHRWNVLAPVPMEFGKRARLAGRMLACLLAVPIPIASKRGWRRIRQPSGCDLLQTATDEGFEVILIQDDQLQNALEPSWFGKGLPYWWLHQRLAFPSVPGSHDVPSAATSRPLALLSGPTSVDFSSSSSSSSSSSVSISPSPPLQTYPLEVDEGTTNERTNEASETSQDQMTTITTSPRRRRW